MSDSKQDSYPTGFSTGALEKGDFTTALRWLNDSTDTDAVEISALRFEELEPTVRELPKLKLEKFRYVSFHAPSSFRADQEETVLRSLMRVHDLGWNIVVHPDVIYNPDRWKFLGKQLLIENMDRRKSIGRTLREMRGLFAVLPEARFCLDVAHARQLDTTLTLLFQLFEGLCDRIAEIHISELDSRFRHIQMSRAAVWDYQSLPWSRLKAVPVIIESMLDRDDVNARLGELRLARKALMSCEGPAHETQSRISARYQPSGDVNSCAEPRHASFVAESPA